MIATFKTARCIGQDFGPCKSAGGVQFHVVSWQPWTEAGYCIECARTLRPDLIKRSVPSTPLRHR